MSQDNESGNPGAGRKNSTDPAAEEGPSIIPPPAFPPGSRRTQMRERVDAAAKEVQKAMISPEDPNPVRSDVSEDAFISPDEPMPDRPTVPDDAFISPDEPIPHHAPRTPGFDLQGIDTADVVVTGMGDDAHLDPAELVAGGDPHVMDLIEKVAKLAAALKKRGEAGLRTTPEMGRFEATLRAYCVGYLAGRRAQDDGAGND